MAPFRWAAVQNYNPITLTPDSLKYSGIIPTDWELARPPVLSPSMAKIVFQSGVTIAAQTNRIVFSEFGDLSGAD
jgi:hypothetical protein